MDLIYANHLMVDQGVLQDYDLDLAYGSGENNFELTLPTAAHCCQAGYYIYVEGTEYGGIIDSIAVDSENEEVMYKGRTWHGILNSKILVPPSGSAYLTLTGTADVVLNSLLTSINLSGLFEVSGETSSISVSGYQMERYISAYDGIHAMLLSVGGKLLINFSEGKVVLSIVPIYNYAEDEEFDSDNVAFTLERSYHPTNHYVCLGSGELTSQYVLHLYVDTDGTISQTQTQFGADEIAAVVESSGIGSDEEFAAACTNLAEEERGQTSMSISLNESDTVYDIGDIVGAIDNITGITGSAKVTKKIVKIARGVPTISYKVGGN